MEYMEDVSGTTNALMVFISKGGIRENEMIEIPIEIKEVHPL